LSFLRSGQTPATRLGDNPAVKLPLVILLTVLAHLAFTGARMSASLYALKLDASTFSVGLLMSLWALLPMLLAIFVGRMIDRVGAFRPLAWAAFVFTLGVLLPVVWPGLPALYVMATVCGTAFMVYHVALNNIVGGIGEPASRATNFSWLALGFSIGGFSGPLVAGMAIDGFSHRAAFGILALSAAAALVPMLVWRRLLPDAPRPGSGTGGTQRIGDLLRVPALRNAFLASMVLATGWDLYTFVMPVYGSRIGLAATAIGVIMGAFAAATFFVRLLMPAISRRVKEWPVIVAAMAIAGTVYAFFPFATSMPLLMALSFLLGIGLGCAQPMIMALLYTASPPGRQGEVIGVRSLMMNASHTALPLGFGALGSVLGIGPIFWLMSVGLLTAGFTLHRRLLRRTRH